MIVHAYSIGDWSHARHSHAICIGDFVSSRHEGDIVVGWQLFGVPMPDSVQQAIRNNPTEARATVDEVVQANHLLGLDELQLRRLMIISLWRLGGVGFTTDSMFHETSIDAIHAVENKHTNPSKTSI